MPYHARIQPVVSLFEDQQLMPPGGYALDISPAGDGVYIPETGVQSMGVQLIAHGLHSPHTLVVEDTGANDGSVMITIDGERVRDSSGEHRIHYGGGNILSVVRPVVERFLGALR